MEQQGGNSGPQRPRPTVENVAGTERKKVHPKRRRHCVAREERLAEVSRMYLRGATQAMIAVKLGVDRSTISYDIKALEQEWRDIRFRKLDRHKSMALAKIDEIERAAWSEWDKSQRDIEIVSEGPKGITKTRRGQCGDSRYLKVVLECAAQRCQLLGLDAWFGNIDWSKLTDEQVKRIAEGEYPEFVLATSGTGTSGSDPSKNGNGSLHQ